jgi:hypothetical protein
LTGELPFRGNQRMLLHQVINDEPRAPHSLNDRVPRDLETICLKAMAKEPERRYDKAAQFAADLNRYLLKQPILARPVGRVERIWCKRNPVVAGLMAAVVVSLTAGIVASTGFAIRASEREDEAVDEWKRAEGEKTRADTKADEALAEKARANQKTSEAVQEKERAEKQLDRAEWLLYVSQIASAQRAWETSFVSDARLHLNSTRDDFRGWEYRYLYTSFLKNQTTLEGHTGGVSSFALSSDGNRIVSGSSDKTLKVWDAANGNEIFTLKGHIGGVTSVAFSPDGTRIVSGSEDEPLKGTIKIWDAVNNKEIITLKDQIGGVTSVAFSPDGTRIVSGSQDDFFKTTIRIWDAASGQETLALKGQTGRVSIPTGNGSSAGGPIRSRSGTRQVARRRAR